MVMSFVLSFFPRGVLDEILNLIESVSEDFPSYFFTHILTRPKFRKHSAVKVTLHLLKKPPHLINFLIIASSAAALKSGVFCSSADTTL